ncbi:MAG: Flp pilus assembly protein TadG [Ascidiaceihabitans sp.]|jgi:Flp pilus assembly protein TadG|tara:strand:- start:3727 stop:5160 length:1434 start_codon:yes stop_codon:yes gene_type:complete
MSVLKSNKNALKNLLTPNEMLFMLKNFARKEDGAMTIFAVFMFFMMLLVAGLGVDLMRNEMERTKIQNTIDRAVLAAADLDQTLNPSAVVSDYMDKAGVGQHLSQVTVNEGLNFRTVTAAAQATTPTQFMSFLGVDELTSPARSGAEERISNVEISMVLDISGSMGRNGRMGNLRTAAKAFVDEVIRVETDDLISVSLVPYTAQTNAGEAIFNELNTTKLHSYSHCIDFEQSDFNSAGLDLNKSYEHMQHFEASSTRYRNSAINNPGCPKRSYEEIVPLSQNKASLKATIDNYTARANTAINLGMKWGVALLDPSFQPITQALRQQGKVDAAFADRPSSYTDDETLKTIILMTDGVNVNTVRIQPWYYANPSHYVHWNYNALYYYLNRYVSRYRWNGWRYTKYTSSQADTMLSNICSAAKAQGIVIWSVGFEVSDFSAGIMRSCASSPSHFFRVEGVEITEAFKAIASQINQLRLIQ